MLVFLCAAFAGAGACGGSKNKQEPTTTGSGSGAGSDAGSDLVYAKKVAVSWGITKSGAGNDVFLQTTDETGKQTSYPAGTYPGTCQLIEPSADMKALSGVNCTDGDHGIELHAVIDAPRIIVLKLPVQVGVAPDPMAREEVMRIEVAPGAAIERG